MSKKLGDSIKSFRKKIGLTQPELAEKLNVSFSTVRRWEVYDGNPRSDEIKKLCEIFHCTESELLNGLDDSQVKVTLSYNWEDFKKGEINMNKSEFKLILGDDGEVGINGSMMVKSRNAIEELLAKIRSELEFGFDSQVRRGIIQEA